MNLLLSSLPQTEIVNISSFLLISLHIDFSNTGIILLNRLRGGEHPAEYQRGRAARRRVDRDSIKISERRQGARGQRQGHRRRGQKIKLSPERLRARTAHE